MVTSKNEYFRLPKHAHFLRDLGRGIFEDDSQKSFKNEFLLHTLFFIDVTLLCATDSSSRHCKASKNGNGNPLVFPSISAFWKQKYSIAQDRERTGDIQLQLEAGDQWAHTGSLDRCYKRSFAKSENSRRQSYDPSEERPYTRDFTNTLAFADFALGFLSVIFHRCFWEYATLFPGQRSVAVTLWVQKDGRWKLCVS